MGHNHSHAHQKGNDSKAKFAVIFSLLLFFALTVAGQMVFVGGEAAATGGEHFSKSGEAHPDADMHEDAEPEKQHRPSRKKH